MAAVGFRDLPVEWLARAQNLRDRFPRVSEPDIARALLATEGHAGKSIKHLEQAFGATHSFAAQGADGLWGIDTHRQRSVSQMSDGRPSHLPPAQDPPQTPNADGVAPPSVPPQQWNKCVPSIIFVAALLVSSLCTNAFFFWLRSGSEVSVEAPPAFGQSAGARDDNISMDVDTDGDGIPDHNDFCPQALNAAKWSSGKATDFDGDGCQDGVEDSDIDNDGIHDPDDQCPRTPMSYSFVSNLLSDFDSDGCADSVEDADNDNDNIANTLDECPKTHPHETSDPSGCSQRQLALPIKEEDHSWWEVLGSTCKIGQHNDVPMNTAAQPSQDDSPWWHDWIGELKGAWAEIFVGAILTTALTKVNGLATFLQQRLPRDG